MEGIIKDVQEIKDTVGDDILIIAGKMHDAGSYDYVTEKQVKELKKVIVMSS